MSLDARVGVELGTFAENVALTVGDGEVVAVLGPNGSGKTTLLRALAGVQPLSSGHVRVDGELLDDPGSRYFVPPDRRSCGLVFQEHLLFPRLSVLENVAFGPRCRGASRAEATARARDWLERLSLREWEGVRPSELSGGQSQRVALARALATEPRLLLLDEPTAALDAGQRGSVRSELRAHLREFSGSCILVTHDPLEASVVADRMVILEDGRAVQSGTFLEMTRRPGSAFVAELVGRNLFSGETDGHVVTFQDGPTLQSTDPGSGSRLAVVLPSDVTLSVGPPPGDPADGPTAWWPTTIVDIELLGDIARVRLGHPVGTTALASVAQVAALGLTEGSPAWASVDPTRVNVYEPGSPTPGR